MPSARWSYVNVHYIVESCVFQAGTLLIGEQVEDGCVLEHHTLEVLVLTQCWGGKSTFALRCITPASTVLPLCGHVHMVSTAKVVFSRTICRCSQLRTLVIMLDEMQDWIGVNDLNELNNLIAGMPALAKGAPGLRALQLVLPMLDGTFEAMYLDLGPLWRGLGALTSLTSLALGWAFMAGERCANNGERVANVLDAAQVSPAAMVCACVTCAAYLAYQPSACLGKQVLHLRLRTLLRQR